ncbi:MAG: hypothetical protein ABW202_11690 [Duganella sp.]
MTDTHRRIAVIGAGLAGLSCAQHVQWAGCAVTMFDKAGATGVVCIGGLHLLGGHTISEMYHEPGHGGWRLHSVEHGAHKEGFDALLLALPAAQAATLLEPLLPWTAIQCSTAALGADGARVQPAVWLPAVRVGVCGDWLAGGRLEGAWLSGRALAAQVLAQGATVTSSFTTSRSSPSRHRHRPV